MRACHEKQSARTGVLTLTKPTCFLGPSTSNFYSSLVRQAVNDPADIVPLLRGQCLQQCLPCLSKAIASKKTKLEIERLWKNLHNFHHLCTLLWLHIAKEGLLKWKATLNDKNWSRMCQVCIALNHARLQRVYLNIYPFSCQIPYQGSDCELW